MSSDSEVLPSYSLNSDRLPPYSRLPEAPISKLLPNHYVTRSRRMALDLGQRYQSTPVPAFGREGLIEGHVWIQSFEHVEKIQVTLTGAVVSYFLEFGTATSRPSVKRLVHQTHEIWSVTDENPDASKEGRSLAFAIVLPERVDSTGCDSGRPIPLPPSASIIMSDACAHIAYTVRVDLFRAGWRSHDTVKTEILYLPRTRTHYSRPYIPLPNSEKLRPFAYEEWAVAFVPQKSQAIPSAPTSKGKLKSQSHASLPQCVGDDIVVRLWLPNGLRYPSGRQILWGVTFVFPRTAPSTSNEPVSGLSDYDTDALLAGVSLKLVCISTVAVRGAASRRERVVAVGEAFCLLPDTRTELGEKKATIRGYLQSGEAERDMSWGVSGFASVVYEIRVSVKPSQNTGPELPTWEYSERIMITSHEADGEMHNAGVPALLLPGATRAPVPLVLMGL